MDNNSAFEVDISADINDAADDGAGQRVIVAGVGVCISKVDVEVRRENGGLLDAGVILEGSGAGKVETVAHPPVAVQRLRHIGNNSAVEGAVFKADVVVVFGC